MNKLFAPLLLGISLAVSAAGCGPAVSTGSPPSAQTTADKPGTDKPAVEKPGADKPSVDKPSTPPAPTDAPKTDQERIQGAWKGDKLFFEDGHEDSNPYQLVFKGDKYDLNQGALGKLDTYGFKLDPSTKPAAFDQIDAKGRTIPGIYKLDGDTLTIAWGQSAGSDRPKGFEKGASYQIFKREKK